MKEQLIKLLQVVIICATVVFIFVRYQSNNNNILDESTLNLEKEKFEYQKQLFQYLTKVDSLESHIKSLEDKKKENTIVATKKKKEFRELKPSEQVIIFNKLFNSFTTDEQR